jgi:hypothetical protein
VSAILLAGAIVGVLAGWRWKHTHRAFRDWRDAVVRVPRLRRIFFGSGWWSLIWGVVALAMVWLLLAR